MPDHGSIASALGPLLWPLGCLYGGIVRVRNAYYDRCPSAAHAAPLPVISVGNLTAGGTGKTPMVIELVRRLRELGRRPAILTRGYHAAPGTEADEVHEFRLAVPEVPVVVEPDRVAGAAAAHATQHADCVVLDDGFQHRRLRRDLDIVLLDALDPWGGRRMLPAGRLREPPAGLRRAHVLVITRANQVTADAIDKLRSELARLAPQATVATADVEVAGLRDATGGHADLAGRPVLGVVGLGNPATFEQLLGTLATPAETLRFGDHHRYTPADVARVRAAAARCRAAAVVTTRKDWVKLHTLWPVGEPPLLRLDVRLRIQDGATELDRRLRAVVEGRS